MESSTSVTDHDIYPASHMRAAQALMVGHELPPLSNPWLLKTVLAALEAQNLYFTVAPYEPSAQDLDSFFEDFILRCIDSHGIVGAQ